MMDRFPRARWVALASVVALSFGSGAWLMRPAPAIEGGIYQQARLFENVVSAIHATSSTHWARATCTSGLPVPWWRPCTIPTPSCW